MRKTGGWIAVLILSVGLLSGAARAQMEPKLKKAAFGAGCFWHVQAAFGKWGSGLHLSQLFSKNTCDK